MCAYLSIVDVPAFRMYDAGMAAPQLPSLDSMPGASAVDAILARQRIRRQMMAEGRDDDYEAPGSAPPANAAAAARAGVRTGGRRQSPSGGVRSTPRAGSQERSGAFGTTARTRGRAGAPAAATRQRHTQQGQRQAEAAFNPDAQTHAQSPTHDEYFSDEDLDGWNRMQRVRDRRQADWGKLGITPGGGRVTPPAAQSPLASAPAGASPTAVRGLTRSEIAGSKTPQLTQRLVDELAGLCARVGEDASQHLHAIRQCSDMAVEVVARWRRSTTLALSSIASLEEESARKTDHVRDLGVRLADKDAALASVEAERDALKAYANRLELQLGRILEAEAMGTGGAASEFAVAAQAINAAAGKPAASGPLSPSAAVVAAAMNRVRSSSPSAAAFEVASETGLGDGLQTRIAELRNAVRESGPDSDRVRRFFDALDGAAVAPTGAGASQMAPRGAPATPAAASSAASAVPASPAFPFAGFATGEADVEATLRRAMAFVTLVQQQQKQQQQPQTPSGAAALPSARAAALGATLSAGLVTAQPLPATPVLQAGMGLGPALGLPSGARVSSLDIDLDPALYQRATVGALKKAVAARSGKVPLSIVVGGKLLDADDALLRDVGIPVKARIQVVFGEEAPAAVAGAGSIAAVPSAPATAPAAPSGPHPGSSKRGPIAAPPPYMPVPHTPMPAGPQATLPAHMSPPRTKQPLSMPSPHAAPQILAQQLAPEVTTETPVAQETNAAPAPLVQDASSTKEAAESKPEQAAEKAAPPSSTGGSEEAATETTAKSAADDKKGSLAPAPTPLLPAAPTVPAPAPQQPVKPGRPVSFSAKDGVKLEAPVHPPPMEISMPIPALPAPAAPPAASLAPAAPAPPAPAAPAPPAPAAPSPPAPAAPAPPAPTAPAPPAPAAPSPPAPAAPAPPAPAAPAPPAPASGPRPLPGPPSLPGN
jgi:hypothetical protein